MISEKNHGNSTLTDRGGFADSQKKYTFADFKVGSTTKAPTTQTAEKRRKTPFFTPHR